MNGMRDRRATKFVASGFEIVPHRIFADIQYLGDGWRVFATRGPVEAFNLPWRKGGNFIDAVKLLDGATMYEDRQSSVGDRDLGRFSPSNRALQDWR